MIKESEIISKVLLSIERYKGYFSSFLNAILLNEYTSSSKIFTRVLLWKTCLITQTLNIHLWRSKLKACRAVYHELRRSAEMTIPWWALDKDSEYFLEMPPKKRLGAISQLRMPYKICGIKGDPLNDAGLDTLFEESQNCIKKDVDLLSIIILDVQRLFPGDPVFHGCDGKSTHKRLLITVLFTWSKCNLQVGYKQGIHEILGLIYKNMLDESLEISNTNTFSFGDLEILSLYDLHYLEHDLFFLMNKFLVNSGIISLFYQSEALLTRSIQQFNGLLLKVDQLIHYNLITKLKLDSQLWAMRFFRLLLVRELGNNHEIPSLFWDKLAAAEASNPPGAQCLPELMYFSVVILLIHLKAELALCDFDEALSLLLHYPISTRLNLYPNFIEDLFQDAYGLLKLRNDDRKLYEYGLRLNKKFQSVIKIKVNFTTRDILPNKVASSSREFSTEVPAACDTRRPNMAFEKTRLELRLKKRAQLVLKE